MKRKGIKKVVALLLASAMMITGCGSSSDGGSSSGGTAEAKDTFVVGIDADLTSMDPAQCNAFTAEFVVDSMFDTLLQFSQDGTKVEPCLAKSYEVKDDAKKFVYELRDDVTFWDGKKMTAEDVVYSLQRHMDAENASLFGYFYDPVKSIEATGDFEVTIQLKESNVSFEYALATMAGAIIEKDFTESSGEQFGKPSTGVMGTGSYKFESWTEGSQIVLAKNDSYWNKDAKLLFNKVEFNVIEDEASRAMALTSGQVDLLNKPTNDVKEQLVSAENVTYYSKKGYDNTYIAFNCSRAPFDDANARKAAAYAIDAVAIAEAMCGKDGYVAGKSMDFDEDVMKYDEENWTKLESELDAYDYNVEKAKEYLAKSAYPDGFEVTMPVCAMVQKVSESTQYYLKEVGITVNLETVPVSQFYSMVYGSVRDEKDKRDYDLIAFIWFPDYPDPISYLNTLYYSTGEAVGGSNMMGYQNSEFDKLIDKQAGETKIEDRSATMAEAYKLLNNDCPAKQLFYNGPIYAINSDYDLDMSPMWFWNFNLSQITLASK